MNILTSIGNMFTAVCGQSQWNKVGLSVGAAITAYLTPIVGLLFACFCFTVIDMYYGIKVARKQGQKITSKKNWQGTLIKIKDEFTILLLSHLLEFTVLNDKAPFVLTGGTCVIICLTELWSILENLNTLDPEGPWRSLNKFLKKKGTEYVGPINNDENDKDDNSVATKP